LSVGKRLACPGAAVEEADWVELLEDPTFGSTVGPRVKGSLLLELAALHKGPPPPPPPPAPPPAPPPPCPAAVTASGTDGGGASSTEIKRGEGHGAAAETVSGPGPPPLDDVADGAVPSPPGELSGSGSDEDDDGTETEQEGPDWTPATNGNKSTDDATPQAPPPPDLLSPQAMMELLATTVSDVVQRPSEWLPFGSSGARGGLSPAVGSHQAEASGYDTDGALTIFAVNEQVVAHSNRLFQFLKKWSKKRVRVKKVKKALRSTLDPRARQQRREARKWRMWHDIFCVLNDIERQLGEALGLLMQASASEALWGEPRSTERFSTTFGLSR